MGASIGRKINALVGSIVGVGLVALTAFYAGRQEELLLRQNERTMVKVTESVTQALRTVMLAGYADISQEFGDHLKHVADVTDLRILRLDGQEAFRDNRTIQAVNTALGEDRFRPRLSEQEVRGLDHEHPGLRAAADHGETITYYERTADDERRFTILAPVISQEACQACHTDEYPVRGVLKLTTSLAHLDGDIRSGRIKSGIVILLTLVLVLGVVRLVVRRLVVSRIETATGAMLQAAHGDLSHSVPETGDDELTQMARSFNTMTAELSRIYSGLRHEQNKLTTILLGSRDGIVVTGGRDQVCLVNPAAEQLLGKRGDEIREAGFLKLLDNPDWARARLEVPLGEQRPELTHYKDRILSVYMASIRAEDETLIGSAALLRDVTEQKRLQDELERLSITDGLTGLYNRRHFDQKLNEEFQLALRYCRPLSLLLLDVDHFKHFNDTYGHDQGDRVLQAIAKVLQTLRAVDVPCRHGGEEFAVILPNTPIDKAVLTAERLRGVVAQTEVDGLAVTMSIGVAACPPLIVDRPDSLVKAADQALYVSKQAGRNRVSQAAVHTL